MVAEIDRRQLGAAAYERHLLLAQALHQRRIEHCNRGIDRSGACQQLAYRLGPGLRLGTVRLGKYDLAVELRQLLGAKRRRRALEQPRLGTERLRRSFRGHDLAAQFLDLAGEPIAGAPGRLGLGLARLDDICVSDGIGEFRRHVGDAGCELDGDHLRFRNHIDHEIAVIGFDRPLLRRLLAGIGDEAERRKDPRDGRDRHAAAGELWNVDEVERIDDPLGDVARPQDLDLTGHQLLADVAGAVIGAIAAGKSGIELVDNHPRFRRVARGC